MLNLCSLSNSKIYNLKKNKKKQQLQLGIQESESSSYYYIAATYTFYSLFAIVIIMLTAYENHSFYQWQIWNSLYQNQLSEWSFHSISK